jgi:hypothetical protein
MATIVYKTWSTTKDEIEIYCYDEGIGIDIVCHTGVNLTIDYRDLDLLIKFLQDFRQDKE